MRKLRLILPAAVMATWLAFGVAPVMASTIYSSLPASGVVQIPSEGVEAQSFNQIGNEVILDLAGDDQEVSVTMVGWACQAGRWNTGDCVTTPGRRRFRPRSR